MHLGSRRGMKPDQIAGIDQHGAQSPLPKRNDDGEDAASNGRGENNLNRWPWSGKTANCGDQFDVAGAHGMNQKKHEKRAAGKKASGDCAPQTMPALQREAARDGNHHPQIGKFVRDAASHHIRDSACSRNNQRTGHK